MRRVAHGTGAESTQTREMALESDATEKLTEQVQSQLRLVG